MKKWISLCIFSLLISACSSIDKYDTSTPQGAFQVAEKYAEAERYEEAISRYSEVRAKFPYSKYASEAELRIADIQYKRESYIEAATAYQLFREYHPKHPKIDYIIYRLGMSYYKQLPKTIDRDLSPSKDALDNFDLLITRYPNSGYVPEVKEKKAEVLNKLAEKELYIADFYFFHKHFESSLGRYEGLIREYPSSPKVPKAMLGGYLSAIKIDDKETAARFYRALGKVYPGSAEFREAQSKGSGYGVE